MKRLRVPCLLALIVTSALLATSAQAQAQPPIQTPQQALTSILEMMREEKLTPRQLWEEGLLTPSLLLRALGDDRALDPGLQLWGLGEEGTGFVELLLAEIPQVLKQPGYLNMTIRVRLAQYYMAKKDPRGAAMMEDIIAHIPRENADITNVYTPLTLLSKHYQYTGKRQQAIETLYRITEFAQGLRPTPVRVTVVLLRAASIAAGHGDMEQEKQLLEKVHSYKQGWGSARAYAVVARSQFREGKLEEGRALLKTPFEGEGADEFRWMIDTELARSYFGTKEWAAALYHTEAAIKVYKSMEEPPDTPRMLRGLESMAKTARQNLEQEQTAKPARPASE